MRAIGASRNGCASMVAAARTPSLSENALTVSSDQATASLVANSPSTTQEVGGQPPKLALGWVHDKAVLVEVIKEDP